MISAGPFLHAWARSDAGHHATYVLCCTRLTEPITDRETLALAEHFQTHGLLEHVARARKRALGSHFPRTELG